VNLEMHSDIMIERVWRCTCGGRNRASLEIHLEVVIERDWTSTSRRSMDGAPGLNSSVSQLATMEM